MPTSQLSDLNEDNSIPIENESDSISDQHSGESLISYLYSRYFTLKSNQYRLDHDEEIKPIVGRKRKCTPLKSDQILADSEQFLYDELIYIVNKLHKYSKRKDALLTVTIRALKRLLPHLKDRHSTQSRYKEKGIFEFSYSFMEAFSALSAVHPIEDDSVMLRYVEFIVPKFPPAKVKKILTTLKSE